MANLDYSPYGPSRSAEDRRSHQTDPSMTPKRRLNDSLFNKVRWPALIYFWFALGIILFIYVFIWRSMG